MLQRFRNIFSSLCRVMFETMKIELDCEMKINGFLRIIRFRLLLIPVIKK